MIDLLQEKPSLSRSPKLPKLTKTLRETRRHARTRSQIDMLDPDSQIEMYQDLQGERVIKGDRIMVSNSFADLDNPTALNSRVDTTESSRRQDTETV